MTDPYQPAGPYAAAYGQIQSPPGSPQATLTTKIAAITILLASLLLAIAAVANVALASDEQLLEQADPQQLAELESQGFGLGMVRTAGAACVGGCGLVVIGIGVLLAVYVWKGHTWAAVTALVLSIPLAGFYALSLVVYLAFDDEEILPGGVHVAIVATTALVALAMVATMIAQIVALADSRRKGGTSATAAAMQQQQQAWQAYYAQQHQQRQQQAGWPPPNEGPHDPPQGSA